MVVWFPPKHNWVYNMLILPFKGLVHKNFIFHYHSWSGTVPHTDQTLSGRNRTRHCACEKLCYSSSTARLPRCRAHISCSTLLILIKIWMLRLFICFAPMQLVYVVEFQPRLLLAFPVTMVFLHPLKLDSPTTRTELQLVSICIAENLPIK